MFLQRCVRFAASY